MCRFSDQGGGVVFAQILARFLGVPNQWLANERPIPSSSIFLLLIDFFLSWPKANKKLVYNKWPSEIRIYVDR